MAAVTAAMVKDLREKTGAGMMDCKAALNETQGELEAAVDWLRKKGLAKAAKKSGRIAADGLVAVAVEGGKGVVLELNAETDFVARNEDFQTLARNIAQVALKSGDDVEAIKAAAYPGGGVVAEAIANAIATIGENMTLRRVGLIAVKDGVIGQYVHGAISDGLGKIGVIVGLESTGDKPALAGLARQIAMHIAAASPLALNADGVDRQVVDREAKVLREKNAGKPDHVLDKIVESGLKSYFKEVTLSEQVSIHADHNNKTIAQTVKEFEGKVGAPIALVGFLRFALGEGVEKADAPDFAEEVAKMSKGEGL